MSLLAVPKNINFAMNSRNANALSIINQQSSQFSSQENSKQTTFRDSYSTTAKRKFDSKSTSMRDKMKNTDMIIQDYYDSINRLEEEMKKKREQIKLKTYEDPVLVEE